MSTKSGSLSIACVQLGPRKLCPCPPFGTEIARNAEVCHALSARRPIYFDAVHISISESKQKKKKKKILQSKKVSNTVLKSSLRAIERYAYCLGYWYFMPRYGFPKSNGTVSTFYNKIQWKGWHRAVSFNYQVHTTPHPVFGIYMSPVQ